MSKPYSEDLRLKVIEALRKGTPLNRISKFFHIARSTIYKWKEKFELTGSCKALPGNNGSKYIIDDLEKFKEFVCEKPDRTQEEMAKEWGNIGARSIGNTLKRAGFTYKKKHLDTAKETTRRERLLLRK